MSAELDGSLKPSYDITVRAILFDYKSSDTTSTIADAIKDIDYNNIAEFSIDSNPRKLSVNVYSLKLKNILKAYQDLFLNTNIVFYIKVVENIPFGDKNMKSIVLENYFKVFSYSFNDSGSTLFLDYNLITFSASSLLFSQRYNSNAEVSETLITISSAQETIVKIMDTARKYFASNINLLFEEYKALEFIAAMSLPKDIVFRSHIHSSGLNRFAYNNVRLPISNDLNDITIINHVMKKYNLYLSPSWFIFDDSRMGRNYNTEETSADDEATTARVYTYAFINTFNIATLTKSSCWNTAQSAFEYTEAIDTSGIGADALAVNSNTTSQSYSNADNILDVMDANGIDYVPTKAFMSEFKLQSNMSRVGSLINGEDLKKKLRSRIILRTSDDKNITIEPSTNWNNGIVNTIHIDSDMPSDQFLLTLQCEKFLYESDASIYKAQFNNMRYNVLDYNISYDLITKSKYNYVLLSFHKTFTFNGEAKGYNLQTDCEFLYLPDTVLVSLKDVGVSLSGSTSDSVVDFMTNALNTLTGNNDKHLPKGIDYEIFRKLSAADQKSVMQSLAAGVADNLKYSKTQSGKATYYTAKSADSIYTARGDIFDENAQTCASNTYPFGTKLLVINKDNGMSTIVEVNDTGGFDKGTHANSGRVIDLTVGAAKAINMVNSGVANVDIQVLEWGDGKRVRN